MSADNWANCPRCIATDEAGIETLEKKLRDSYGKVSVESYELLRKELSTAKNDFRNGREDYSKFATFREDYEFYGADDGILQIVYSGCCTKCGLNLKFHESKEFYKSSS